MKGRVIMKKYLMLVCMLASLPAWAQMRTLPTQIRTVTVYGDRALVTRVGTLTLSTGSYELKLSGLPAVLDDRSVKVSGEAAGAVITDVRVETTYLDTIPDERVTALQKKIDDLKHEQTTVRYRLGALHQELQFVSEIKAQPGSGAADAKSPKYTVEDWQRALAFMTGNLQRVNTAILAGEEDASALQKKIDAAQKQLSDITARIQRETKTLVVDVDVKKAGGLNLTASYVVYNARWIPQYDVRASRDANTVQVEYRAAVQQSTGEDWTNVDLALSTARPDVGGVKPELPPWFISETQPVMMRSYMQKGAVAPGAMKTENAAAPAPTEAAAPLVAMEETTAGVATGVTSALYTISGKSSIPSDNVAHKTGIAIEALPVEFSYIAAPKLSPFVYLKGTVKNTTEYPFLPGVMNVFGEREFLAQSAMKLVGPNETFEASFGIDPSMAIERKLINRSTASTGTFSKSTKVTYHFQFTLSNKKTRPVTVSVQDQVPVPQNEKIVVEQLEPRDLARTDQGLVTFTWTLQPGEKKVWDFQFSVEYPRDMKVSGLE